MATHIKELLGEFLKEKQQEFQIKEKIEVICNRVFGAGLSGQVKVEKIEKTRITFSCPASEYKYEINLNKDKIIKQIQKDFPEIKEIRIRIR
jgi:hypothetical protein